MPEKYDHYAQTDFTQKHAAPELDPIKNQLDYLEIMNASNTYYRFTIAAGAVALLLLYVAYYDALVFGVLITIPVLYVLASVLGVMNVGLIRMTDADQIDDFLIKTVKFKRKMARRACLHSWTSMLLSGSLYALLHFGL